MAEPMNGNLPQKLNFVIVGGSLGGLAAGIALKTLGHNTTILERNPTPLLHDQGAGIVAGGDALEFLERYNRCKRPIAVSSHRRQYLDKPGNVVHKVDMIQNMSSWDLTYHIFRANYDGHPSAYCDVPSPDPSHGSASHFYNRTATSLEDTPAGILVHWKSTTDPSVTGSLLADRVVGADGPSSTIRSLFVPNLERTYAGYCALRGTVPESEASPETLSAFAHRFTFYHGPGIQILAYLIPGINGTVEPGKRLINFVYYTNFPAESPDLDEILTDVNGTRRRITIPPGMVSPEAWEGQKLGTVAKESIFIKTITDNFTPYYAPLIGLLNRSPKPVFPKDKP